MGVNSKGTRKLVYSGFTYYWNVKQDAKDYGRINLNIVSEDRKFIVSYHVAQTNHEKIPHILVKGIRFGGLDNHYRVGWVRVQTPI